MAEHFKLEITNRSTKITTWTGVSDDFANEYKERLGVDDSLPDDYIPAPMSDALKTVLNPPPSENADKDKPNENQIVSKSSAKKNDGKYAKYNYAKRVKKRRSTFRTLAYINFRTPNVQFVTLTFDTRIFDNANDLQTCHKAFQKFIKRIRHQYDDFRYLAVFSRQTNKNWHYHMICNFDETVSGKTIHDLWTYGIVHNTVLTKYDEFDTKVSYCIDNMESVSWDELQGEKGYLNSKGLQNKIVLRSWNENESDMAYEYLRQILQSDDIPYALHSVTKKDKLPSSSKAYDINYLVSHKGFAELFAKPIVAKKK